MATIITKNSATPSQVPSSLTQGELAINVIDGKLYYGSGSGNAVKEFTGSSTNTGSLLTTASVSLNTITFTKGDGSTFPITVNTGSGGGGSTFPYTGSAIISGSLTVTGSFYVSNSIDSVNKRLIDDGGVASVNWNSYRLYNSSNDLIVHWGTGNLYSGSFTTSSVSWTDRILRDSDGTVTVDWENGLFNDAAGNSSLDVNNRLAYDSNPVVSSDWGSRQLYDDTGKLSEDWRRRQLSDPSETLSIDWENRQLKDSSDVTSIDYRTRQLFASDGSTAALDYNTPESLTVVGHLIPGGTITDNTSSYDLGSATAAWKDLYVSNGSIKMISGSQSASISFTNGALDFGTTPIVSPDVIATASVSSNTITFTKGDGSTFPITVNTGSGGSSQTLLEKATAGYEYYNDFLSTGTNNSTADGQGYIFFFSGTGTGVVSSTPPSVRASNQHGFIRPTTGTVATGYAGIYGGSSGNQFLLGGGVMTFATSVLFNTVSDGTNRYRVTIGYGDQATSAAEVNGIFFTYDEGGTANGTSASPNWQCVTTVNSVRTLTTTSVTVSTTAWHNLKIEVNADGTSVAFYIDNTLVATHTTNIPSGTSQTITPRINISKTLGTTSRFFHVDYLYYAQTYTTPKSL